MQATERAMREAALRLMRERGYEATSTDDIARAAGVSPRTFFNYFATKEDVVFIPQDVLPGLVSSALRARPLGEDLATSMVAALTGVFEQFAQFIGADAAALVRAQVRLILTEPSIRRITFERRMNFEDVVWKVVQERGVSPQDLSARATVTTVISLAFLGLVEWASSDDDDEPLLAVVARSLLAAPHPSRLAAGLTGPSLFP